LRQLALRWLRAELADFAKKVEADPKQGGDVQSKLQWWQKDTDLTAVRDDKALAQLPKDERRDWQSLWTDVAQLLQKVMSDPVSMRLGVPLSRRHEVIQTRFQKSQRDSATGRGVLVTRVSRGQQAVARHVPPRLNSKRADCPSLEHALTENRAQFSPIRIVAFTDAVAQKAPALALVE
jgi:hypothetical protein